MSNLKTIPEPAKRAAQAATVAGGRAIRFAGGFVAGLLALPLLAVVVLLIIWLTRGPIGLAGFHVTSGAEISRAGGVAATWQGGREYVKQTCRDACDDLAFRDKNVASKDVLDAEGRKVKRDGRTWRPPLDFQADSRP